MASLTKPSSRYSSYDTRSSTSSHFSDPSSSVELKPSAAARPSSSRAIVKAKPASSDLSKLKSKPSDPNFTALVRKFMEKRSSGAAAKRPENRTVLVIPSDAIAEDLQRTARKGSNFAALHRKLFGKGTASSSEKEEKKGKNHAKNREVKALTEVKSNTRTLAMVLRSERELLSLTKDQESEISELKFLIEAKNNEVEKLKDLCLKQREEIKALKSAILFSEAEFHDSELKQTKHLIPTLQQQVSSLTGQLQCLAEDLAEVKAEKSSGKKSYQDRRRSPTTPRYNCDNVSNSSDFSLDDPILASPGSPDDMLGKDLNPCLTPYYAKSRSKEFEGMGYVSPRYENLSADKPEFGFNSFSRKLSKSSDCYESSKMGTPISRTTRSDETKGTYGKQTNHKLF